MILTEQELKKYKRPYFQGREKNYNRDKAYFQNKDFLTTNFIYAAFYAKKDGIITEYDLNENINIFNARCKSDYKKLIDYNNKYNLSMPEDTLYKLKNEDWCYVLLGSKFRDIFINIVIDLGYDGFFNFEFSNAMNREYTLTNKFILDFKCGPSIGVLNKNAFTIKRTYNGIKEFNQVENLEKYKNQEKDAFSSIYNFLINDQHLTKEEILKYFKQDSILLTDEELKDLLFSGDFEKIYNESNSAFWTKERFNELIPWLNRSKNDFN